jgi:hypothetical protein
MALMDRNSFLWFRKVHKITGSRRPALPRLVMCLARLEAGWKKGKEERFE